MKDKNEDQDGRKTASGIIIPDSAKSDIDKGQNQAAVIAIGQEAEEKLMGRIEIGDTVLFSRISIDEVKYEGQKYLIVPLENILGVLKK